MFQVSFDLSLARGLDYYTGVIYEAILTGQQPDLGKTEKGKIKNGNGNTWANDSGVEPKLEGGRGGDGQMGANIKSPKNPWGFQQTERKSLHQNLSPKNLMLNLLAYKFPQRMLLYSQNHVAMNHG